MSGMKNHTAEWLDHCGFGLGYHWEDLPDVDHFEIIEENEIPLWEYDGYKSEKDYYSGTKPYKTTKEVIKLYIAKEV